LKNKELTATK